MPIRSFRAGKGEKNIAVYKVTLNNGKEIDVEFVDRGIANRFDNRIEVHKKLLREDYKILFQEILKHEIEHSDKWWSIYDFKHDIGSFKNKKLYWKFVLTTPSSWIQFSPVYPSRQRWYVDITLLIFYLVIGGFGSYVFFRILTRFI